MFDSSNPKVPYFVPSGRFQFSSHHQFRYPKIPVYNSVHVNGSYCIQSSADGFRLFSRPHLGFGHLGLRTLWVSSGGAGGGFGGSGDGSSGNGGGSSGGGDRRESNWSFLPWYLSLLAKYPVMTKTVTSSFLNLVGDVICQEASYLKLATITIGALVASSQFSSMADGTRHARWEEMFNKFSILQDTHATLIEKQNSSIEFLTNSFKDLAIGLQTLDAKVEQCVLKQQPSVPENFHSQSARD